MSYAITCHECGYTSLPCSWETATFMHSLNCCPECFMHDLTVVDMLDPNGPAGAPGPDVPF